MQRMIPRCLLTLSFIFSTLHIHAADMGFMPIVTNYTQADYKGGMQNWSCTQADDGTMYFGNNKGLLSFDGYNWTFHALPSNGVVRSVMADGNRVYVGTYTDFGYFERNAEGKFEFTSLWVKGYQAHNDEIWKIVKAPNGHIYFQSFCSWFDYDGKNVIPHYTPTQLPLYFFPLDNRQVYVQMINGGLSVLQNDRFKPFLRRADYGNDDIVGIHSLPAETLLLVTARNGLFTCKGGIVKPLKTRIDAELKANQVNKATMIGTGTLVLGTILNGVYAINLSTSELLWHYNMENSLKNNTVLGLLTDRSNNIWVALDNGISLIHTALSVTVMRTDKLRQPIGMVYGLSIRRPYMYIATNQAVWLYDMDAKDIKPVSNSGGQNWYVHAFGNQVFSGHNLSTLSIEGTHAVPLPTSREGSTCMKLHHLGGEDVLIESGYYSLRVYNKVNGRWVMSHTVSGFQSPILEFEIDNSGTIWASHISKGLYQIELSKDLTHVLRSRYHGALVKDGIHSQIHVMKIRGRVVFSYQDKLYTYDDLHRRIVPYQELSDLSSHGFISSTQIDNNSFWTSDLNAFTLFNYDGKRYIKERYIPYEMFGLEVNTSGVAQYVDNQDTYFFLNNGIGRFRLDADKQEDPEFPLRIVEVTSTDKDYKTVYLSCKDSASNSIKGDNIRLVLSYPNYNHRQLTFKIKLEGNGKTVETEQDQPVVTFNSLGYGSYLLTVSVVDTAGKTLATTSYRFEHDVPFYLSVWAILLYVVVLYFLIRGYITWRTNKIVRRNQHIAEKELMEQNLKVLEQKQIIAHQQQIIMENELTNKGKELASLALQIATQSSNAESLREELLEKKRKGELTAKDFEKLITAVGSTNDTEAWNIFQQNFDLIHKNFFRNLRHRYPDLTPTDLKFCALLRLNYNTKEIVKFTRLTVRGVEGARYRLRKKLGISNEQSLTDFLIELE